MSTPSLGAVPVWVYDDPMFGTGACARVPDDDASGDIAYTAYPGTEAEIAKRVLGAAIKRDGCPVADGCWRCRASVAAVMAALRGEG